MDVAAAFRVVDRADFLRPADRGNAQYDGPIPIGHGQTNSQPRTVWAMLGLLDVRPGHRVLDVGSGSGWTTALLAHLVGPGGTVLGVERVDDLVAFGTSNLAGYHVPWATIRAADPEQLGAPDAAPFDRILVSASPQELPTELVEQLADDGVLLVPVGATMTRVRRTGPTASDVEITTHGSFSFVPLV
jgi:protein-L-isoaspartate(D-aspartate) O-methyltransferase